MRSDFTKVTSFGIYSSDSPLCDLGHSGGNKTLLAMPLRQMAVQIRQFNASASRRRGKMICRPSSKVAMLRQSGTHMVDKALVSEMSIDDLIGDLSKAIWQRVSIDPKFNLIDHMFHVSEYVPETEYEIIVIEEMTHPKRHKELKHFVNERAGPDTNNYALAIDAYLLNISMRRIHRATISWLKS